MIFFSVRRTLTVSCIGLLGASFLGLAGCGGSKAEFRINRIQISNQERTLKLKLDEARLKGINNVIRGLFGTPDAPSVPAWEGFDKLFDGEKLRMAAGPVGTDKNGRPYGLYRKHCAHCHGVSGDGLGPTAWALNPYPRDYRLGLFKFKATRRASTPREEDLHQILMEGIPGTAMPSFRVLPNDELEALIQYVRYLSIRGEVEFLLIIEAANELYEGDQLVDLTNEEDVADQIEFVKVTAESVAQKWTSSPDSVVPVPPRPESIAGAEAIVEASRAELTELRNRPDPDPDAIAVAASAYSEAQHALEFELNRSIRKGRALFFGETAACSKCHGDSALGDGETNDYDDWTKLMIPTDAVGVRKLVEEDGALKPRNIRPRNLRLGVYRGGRRPIDIFWRIHEGIPGTPMPAATIVAADSGQKGLTTDDIWHIVDYVRSLPFDQMSLPPDIEPVNERMRN